jgi:mRNA interferase MazF
MRELLIPSAHAPSNKKSSTSWMNPYPGEVWLADLGMAAKTRPVVTVSRHDDDAPRALVIYVPLTTQYRGSRYEVVLPPLSFLREKSIANVQGISSLPQVRLERRLGRLPASALDDVRAAIAFVLELP